MRKAIGMRKEMNSEPQRSTLIRLRRWYRSQWRLATHAQARSRSWGIGWSSSPPTRLGNPASRGFRVLRLAPACDISPKKDLEEVRANHRPSARPRTPARLLVTD
jgi:hypothetical protein